MKKAQKKADQAREAKEREFEEQMNRLDMVRVKIDGMRTEVVAAKARYDAE